MIIIMLSALMMSVIVVMIPLLSLSSLCQIQIDTKRHCVCCVVKFDTIVINKTRKLAGYVARRNKLDNLLTTGMIAEKRGKVRSRAI